MTKKTKTETNVTPIHDLAETIGSDHSLTVSDQDVRDHSIKIKASWQKAVSSILETGNLLIEAKAALPHGKFSKLFDKEIGDLPFGLDTAQLLMKIARNPVLANPDYSRLLPPYWRTLSILSRAKTKQLERWIADGTVTAELEQAGAIKLITPVKKTLPEPEPEEPEEEAPEEEAPEEETPEEEAEPAVQLSRDEIEERRRLNKEEALRPVDTDHVVQLLNKVDDRLNDPNVDWDKVIEIAGMALVGNIADELYSRLENYKHTQAEAEAEEATDEAMVH
jgi:hypothetical protein